MSGPSYTAMASMSLTSRDPWAENPRQAAKRRKKERASAERLAKAEARKAELDAFEAEGPVPATSWGLPMEPIVPASSEWTSTWEEEIPQKSTEELEWEQIQENLQYWPWGQMIPRGLVTLAPYKMNTLRDTSRKGQPFFLPEINQTSLLFKKLFNNDVIRKKIVELLFEHHDTASKFAATSRESWKYLRLDTALWDFTRGSFGDCEIPRPPHEVGKPVIFKVQGSVPSVVIITPVRGPKVYPSDIEELDMLPYGQIDDHLYRDQIVNLHKMCLAMSNFADFFQNLQLHRIPFLSTEILDLVIPNMRNLKVLGIYKCELIHIGSTMKLLEIIRTDRPHGKENQISLDFYPNFHQGPVIIPGDKRTIGGYGPVWDNWNGDTRLAVWQLISVILPQAQRQKQDFWSPHTMFRQWLKRTPCWRVTETLETLIQGPGDKRTLQQIDEDFVIMCDAPSTGGSERVFKSKIKNRPEGWQWMLERHPCFQCQLNVLGVHFYYNEIREATNLGLSAAQAQMRCLGCMLTSVLNHETDHYKARKRAILQHWLHSSIDPETGGEVLNTADLAAFISDFHERDVLLRAKHLDHIRVRQMSHADPARALDRERDEMQVPLTRQELGRLGMKNRSPLVESKDEDRVGWNYYEPWRRFRHGHGI